MPAICRAAGRDGSSDRRSLAMAAIESAARHAVHLRALPPAQQPPVRLGGRATLVHHRVHRRGDRHVDRSEEHTSELQSLMRISYAVFCLKKTTNEYYEQDKTDT